MKILAFCPYYPPHIGGLEKYSEELHERLVKEGHSIIVCTSAIPSTAQSIERHGNITTYRFPAWEIIYNYPIPKFTSFAFWKLYKKAKEDQCDVVISVTRFFVTTPIAYFVSRASKVPWLHIEHGSGYIVSSNWVVRFFGYLYDRVWSPFLFTRTSLTITPSRSAQAFVSQFDSRPIPVIYRGFDYAALNAAVPNSALREKYADKAIITYAGRFIGSKGVSDLIRAFASVVKQIPSVLLLAGSGNQRGTIEQEVSQLGLQGSVEFIDEITPGEVLGLFQVSDIVVNPSYAEGLPTVVLEAAACGVATVATDVGGTSEIVQHEISALLYRPGDIDSLTKNIHTLLQDPVLRARLGHNAQRSVREKFNWDNAIDTYLQHFHSIIQ